MPKRGILKSRNVNSCEGFANLIKKSPTPMNEINVQSDDFCLLSDTEDNIKDRGWLPSWL